MIYLLKLLIWGKVCDHEWETLASLESYRNEKHYFFGCKKCGRTKKLKMKVNIWEV